MALSLTPKNKIQLPIRTQNYESCQPKFFLFQLTDLWYINTNIHVFDYGAFRSTPRDLYEEMVSSMSWRLNLSICGP